MIRSRLIPIVSAVSGLALLTSPVTPSSPSGELRSLARDLGPDFKIRQTKHFAILSDAAPVFIDRYEQTLEQTYTVVYRWAADLNLPVEAIHPPMTVILFRHWRDYQDHARRRRFQPDQDVPGFYDHAARQSVMFNYADSARIRRQREKIDRLRTALEKAPPAPPASQPSDESAGKIAALEGQIAEFQRLVEQTVIRHETAHQVLATLGLGLIDPFREPWLHEGMATQFETTTADNPYRRRDFQTAVASGHAIAIRSLLTDPALLKPGSPRSAAAYAAAWALVNHLHRRHPVLFADFLRSRMVLPTKAPTTQPTAIDEFEAAFGPADAAFDARLTDDIAGAGVPK